MVYKRKYKRRSYTKKSQANNNQVTAWSQHSALDKATRALALVNNVRRFINVEVKHHDVSYTSSVLNTTGQVLNLCDPAQGQNLNQRDGISIKPLTLSIQGKLSSTGVSSPQRVRVIIFRGKQENGVAFTTTDILETSDVFAHKNYTDRFRTKTLYDHTYLINPQFVGANPSVPFNFKTKLYGHVNFVEASNSIEGGGIYMLIIKETTNDAKMTIKQRVSFTDN